MQYSILFHDTADSWHYELMEGEPVTFNGFEDMSFAVIQREDIWQVYEVTTGRIVGRRDFDTKEAALAAIEKGLPANADKLRAAIAESITKYGAAPAPIVVQELP